MLFQEVMEWTHPSQTMNKAVFSKYIQYERYLGRRHCICSGSHYVVSRLWSGPIHSQTMKQGCLL